MQDSIPNQQPPDLGESPRGPLGGRGKLIIAVGLLVVALGYLGYTAFQGATVFYLTVGELLDGEADVGETIRVNGKLVPDSFKRDTEGTIARFSLSRRSAASPRRPRRPPSGALLQRALGDRLAGTLRGGRRVPEPDGHRQVPLQVRLPGPRAASINLSGDTSA